MMDKHGERKISMDRLARAASKHMGRERGRGEESGEADGSRAAWAWGRASAASLAADGGQHINGILYIHTNTELMNKKRGSLKSYRTLLDAQLDLNWRFR